MSITKRALPAGFWGPALVVPFHPQRPQFSIDLLARFITTLQKLDPGLNALVLDICVGYGWTTEWLVRMGYRAIGVDICRDYVLAGLPRMGPAVPHLLVADVENLPLASNLVERVLSFDAFHHVPDRAKAMREFERVMRSGGRIALVEPGKQHEHHPGSIAVMKQHGILERGFDGTDLAGYIEGTSLGDIAHHRSDAHPHDIFTVQKAGVAEPDSRSPRSLIATIAPTPPFGTARVGEAPALTITVTNAGDTVWLASTPDGAGTVLLAARLFTTQRELLQDQYAFVRLPRDVRPQEVLSMRIALPSIMWSGSFLVEFDMVDELGISPVESEAGARSAVPESSPLTTDVLWFKDFTGYALEWPLMVTADEATAAGCEGSVSACGKRVLTPSDWSVAPSCGSATAGPVPEAMRPAWKKSVGALARRLAKRFDL
jgi:SAM-dependent methyltransferase